MSSTVKTILFDLKHHKSFLNPLTDISDPYMSSMHTFQAFTQSVIQSLEANQPSTLELAQNETLRQLYADLPPFHEPATFNSWVKDATLKHPQRRTAKQHQYLHIVELQSQQDSPTSIVDIIISAICELEDWRDRTYNPSNLVKDPDIVYFFTQKNGLKMLSFDNGNGNVFANDDDVVQHGDECLICTNVFHPKTNIPQKAPCGHISCTTCFRSWLLKSHTNQTYTCPQCRSCLICGRNPCEYHEIPWEPVVPVPLASILGGVLLGSSGMELHGITAERYWTLRECTRGDRAGLAVIRKTLEVIESREDSISLTTMEKECM